MLKWIKDQLKHNDELRMWLMIIAIVVVVLTVLFYLLSFLFKETPQRGDTVGTLWRVIHEVEDNQPVYYLEVVNEGGFQVFCANDSTLGELVQGLEGLSVKVIWTRNVHDEGEKQSFAGCRSVHEGEYVSMIRGISHFTPAQ